VDLVRSWPVDKKVGDVRNDGQELVKPIPEQASRFDRRRSISGSPLDRPLEGLIKVSPTPLLNAFASIRE
jgi:hypothetical protein